MKDETIIRIKSSIFRLLVGSVYVWALTGATLASTYIQLSQQKLILASILFMLGFCLWFFDRRSFAVVSIAIALCMVVLFIHLHTKDYDVEWFRQLAALVRRLANHVTGLTAYREEFAVLGVGLAGVFALFAAITLRPGLGFFFMSLMGFGVFGALEYFGYPTPGLQLAAFLCIFVLMLVHTLSASAASRREDEGFTVSGLALIPVCLALVIAAALIPKPQANEGRNVMDNLRANTALADGFVYDIFSPKHFSFASTGFSGSGGRLGGNVSLNNRPIMTVYSGGELVYLAGAYKDTYQGDRWGNSESYTVATESYGHVEWSVSEGAITESAAYSRAMRTVTVETTRRTRTIFAPTRVAGIIYQGPRQADISEYFYGKLPVDIESPPRVIIKEGRSLSFEQTIEAGTVYTVAYYPAYEVKAYNSRLLIMDNVSDMKQILTSEQYNSLIETLEPYLALPDDLPQRVRDLAEEITAGEKTVYGKMKALEEFLQKYPYTLSPGPVPEGVDFVDYFLFEGKTGYCTYYATSLAVLARCLGIPTQYAEGYAVTPSLSKNAGGGFNVTNAQAHAWCEAYVPAIGWMSFEATAGYSNDFYGVTESIPSGSAPQKDALEEIDNMLDRAEERLQERQQHTTVPAATQPRDEVPGSSPAEQEIPESGGNGLFWVISSIVAAILAAVALRLWQYRRRLMALESSPNQPAVIGYFNRIMAIGSARGMPIGTAETGMAYCRRISGKLCPEELINGVGGIYSKAAYSGHDISDDERAAVSRCYMGMLDRPHIKAHHRAVEWLQRHILGKY